MTSSATAKLPGPGDAAVVVHVPLTLHRRGGRKLMIASGPGLSIIPPPMKPSSTVVRALVRAFRWQRMLATGTYSTLSEIAAAEGVNPSYLSRVIRLTLLAPGIIEALLDGRYDHLHVRRILTPLPTCWSEQRVALLEK
jgi:hypothetical protein